jgi:hypothetical protein
MINIVGLILWGVSIDQRYHWMEGQVAFFLCKFFAPPRLSGKDPKDKCMNQTTR